jgi:hypothetical protein
MNRNVWAAIAASLIVLAVVILGFKVLGGPRTQRMVQSDLTRVYALAKLAQQINIRGAGTKALPMNLDTFPSSVKQDQVNGESFRYRAKSSREYELCATFATNNREDPNVDTSDPWIHPKGDYCFQFNASQPVPAAPYDYR